MQAAPLVFDLKSQIVERMSIATWEVSTPLYILKDTRIEVRNNFTQSSEDCGDFSIKLVHSKTCPEKSTSKAKKTRKGKGEKSQKTNEKGLELQDEEDSNQMQVFFCPRDNIRVRRGDVQSLVISYLPFSL